MHLRSTTVLLICLVLCTSNRSFGEGQKNRPKFETLSGLIDDCCCDVQTVDRLLYDEHMYSNLAELATSTFFRYFKVNYLKECPFWVENALCSADGKGECGICEPDENEIPQAWNVKPTNKDSIVNWKEEDEDVWIIQDDTDETLYVNLQTNPERYTGFTGGTSANIWQMIYKENCFPDPYECTEERVFYRLISGLHASTTAHICEHFLHPDKTWSPNLDMFIYRLGAFPDRLKNIYFTYVYLLRAAQKASDFLSNYDYYTSNVKEDKRVQSLVKTLLSSSLICSSTFDETALFQGERAVLKREFMAKFRNISEIMDCVTCQTCKVHAKLQILGIATATKILIVDDPNAVKNLQHNEISALINTLFKFSDSIQIIRSMKIREDKHLQQLQEQETQISEGSSQSQPQSQPHQYTSLYALVTVVVLITVATMFSRNNLLKKPQPDSSKKPASPKVKHNSIKKTNDNGADESNKSKSNTSPRSHDNDTNKTNTLRKSSDKVKNNHNTQNGKPKKEQIQS